MRLLLGCLLVMLFVPFMARAEESADNVQVNRLRGELIYLRDYGTDDVGYLVIPDSPPKAGLILIPDGHGLDDWIKTKADEISQQGYLVLVLDLYNGAVTSNGEQARRMEADLMDKGVLASLKTATVFYQQSPRFKTNKVFMISLGGVSQYVLKFSQIPDQALNGAIVIKPSKIFTADGVRHLRYPIQFQLLAGSPAVVNLNRILQEAGPSGMVEIQQISSSGRQITSDQWQSMTNFIRAKSAVQPEKNFFEKILD